MESPSPYTDAIRAAANALAEALSGPDVLAWVDHYTDDAVFVGPDGHSVEGRAALLEIAPVIGMSSVEIAVESVIGTGDLVASLGRGSWVSAAAGPGAPRVQRRFLMVWQRGADGRWRLAREVLTLDPAA